MSWMIDEWYDRLTTIPSTIRMYREVVCMIVGGMKVVDSDEIEKVGGSNQRRDGRFGWVSAQESNVLSLDQRGIRWKTTLPGHRRTVTGSNVYTSTNSESHTLQYSRQLTTGATDTITVPQISIRRHLLYMVGTYKMYEIFLGFFQSSAVEQKLVYGKVANPH